MADDTVGKDVSPQSPGSTTGSEVGAPRDQRSGKDEREKGFLSEALRARGRFRGVVLHDVPQGRDRGVPREAAPHGAALPRPPPGSTATRTASRSASAASLCAWACPADAILVEGADNDDTPLDQGGKGRFSPGERYGRVYQINYLRCIFCGLCIEACPTRALTMTNFYEPRRQRPRQA